MCLAQSSQGDVEIYVNGKRYDSLKAYHEERRRLKEQSASEGSPDGSSPEVDANIQAMLQEILKKLPGGSSGVLEELDADHLLKDLEKGSGDSKTAAEEKIDPQQIGEILQQILPMSAQETERFFENGDSSQKDQDKKAIDLE